MRALGCCGFCRNWAAGVASAALTPGLTVRCGLTCQWLQSQQILGLQACALRLAPLRKEYRCV